MKKIDLSSISTVIGMPIKSGVLTHLQSAYQEAIDAIVKGNIGGNYNSTKFYVIYGVVNTGAGSFYNTQISYGAIFYNGEIYLVDDAGFDVTGSDVVIGTIETTFFSGTNADPITFTDTVARNVLQIRKIVFASGASGSGDVNFSDLVYINIDKTFVGATGAPAFQNTWANYSSVQALFFLKEKGNLVLSGKLQGGTYSSNASTIFTLPVGFRPLRLTQFVANASYLASSKWYTNSCVVFITTAGVVSVLVDDTFLTAAKAANSLNPFIDIYANISLQ